MDQVPAGHAVRAGRAADTGRGGGRRAGRLVPARVRRRCLPWPREVAGESPSEPQIFPEHFDLGITAGPVNYGFSPGDDAIAEPYVYVGPHQLPPPAGDFWNASFGAYRTWSQVTNTQQALDFLRAGHSLLPPQP